MFLSQKYNFFYEKKLTIFSSAKMFQGNKDKRVPSIVRPTWPSLVLVCQSDHFSQEESIPTPFWKWTRGAKKQIFTKELCIQLEKTQFLFLVSLTPNLQHSFGRQLTELNVHKKQRRTCKCMWRKQKGIQEEWKARGRIQSNIDNPSHIQTWIEVFITFSSQSHRDGGCHTKQHSYLQIVQASFVENFSIPASNKTWFGNQGFPE